MVLLEPFSKLSFWSFNHPLGGSLHWIQFFNILLELQALKLKILTVLMSNATHWSFFHLSIPHPKRLWALLTAGPFQHSVLSCYFSMLARKFLPKSMALQDAVPIICVAVCVSTEVYTVFFGAAYSAMQTCWYLLSYLAVSHCLSSSGLISNDFRLSSTH